MKRTYLSLYIDPDVKDALERQAKRERRSLSNLAESLLIWSNRFLSKSIDSQTLMNLTFDELVKRFSQEKSTEVPPMIDEKSYRRALRRQVLTDSERIAAQEKADHVKGQRARSKPANEQEKTPSKADRDRTPPG